MPHLPVFRILSLYSKKNRDKIKVLCYTFITVETESPPSLSSRFLAWEFNFSDRDRVMFRAFPVLVLPDVAGPLLSVG